MTETNKKQKTKQCYDEQYHTGIRTSYELLCNKYHSY